MPRSSLSYDLISDAALGSLAALGARLKEARLLRNWTQADAATKAGLSRVQSERSRPALSTSRSAPTLRCSTCSGCRRRSIGLSPGAMIPWVRRSAVTPCVSVRANRACRMLTSSTSDGGETLRPCGPRRRHDHACRSIDC